MSRKILAVLALSLMLGTPASFAIADAAATYATLFGSEEKTVLATSNGKDDARFAASLLQKAPSLKDEPGMLQLLYSKAFDFGMKDPDGYPTAMAALDAWCEMDVRFMREESAAKYLEWGRAVLSRGRGSERVAAAGRLAPLLVAEADSLVRQRKYGDAIRAYREAAGVATTARLPIGDEIGLKLKAATACQQILDKVERFRARAENGDRVAGREALDALLLELDDPEAALPFARFAPDDQFRNMLQLAATIPTNSVGSKVDEDKLLALSRWYRELANTAPGSRAKTLLRAGKYADLYLISHSKQDSDRLLVSRERDQIYDALTELGITGADTLIVWNTYGGVANDRGTTSINILLTLRSRPVWSRQGVAIDWAAGKDVSLTMPLPEIPFDSVRVEVTHWRGLGGGLSEIQVMRRDKNLAAGAVANVSSAYDRRFLGSQLVDGITSSADSSKGYWLLPNNTAGWAEVVLTDRK